ncbi:hypothetical protein QM012_000168 [Aureobasidium pullulans]|uniref:Uncharacterized protein n=1 Tax=Aureobasidium pullulans TaxID=5580 RepID=A0ABR0TUY9_AURPU
MEEDLRNMLLAITRDLRLVLAALGITPTEPVAQPVVLSLTQPVIRNETPTIAGSITGSDEGHSQEYHRVQNPGEFNEDHKDVEITDTIETSKTSSKERIKKGAAKNVVKPIKKKQSAAVSTPDQEESQDKSTALTRRVTRSVANQDSRLSVPSMVGLDPDPYKAAQKRKGKSIRSSHGG